MMSHCIGRLSLLLAMMKMPLRSMSVMSTFSPLVRPIPVLFSITLIPFDGLGDKIRFFLEEDAVDSNGKLNRPKERAVNKIGHGKPLTTLQYLLISGSLA
jgi:hypothetical protein